jgi:hypothetical protein
MCLKIICSRLQLEQEENIEGDVACNEIYVELKVKGLYKFLNDRDPDQQILTLNILNKMVHQLEAAHLGEVVQAVCDVHVHHNKQCRSVIYEILMWVHDYCKDVGEDIIKQAKSVLLKGLRDDDPFLQDIIFK